jgi:hypothetical protein
MSWTVKKIEQFFPGLDTDGLSEFYVTSPHGEIIKIRADGELEAISLAKQWEGVSACLPTNKVSLFPGFLERLLELCSAVDEAAEPPLDVLFELRSMGKTLNRVGGLNVLQCACEQASGIFPPSRGVLRHVWDGIGEWRR